MVTSKRSHLAATALVAATLVLAAATPALATPGDEKRSGAPADAPALATDRAPISEIVPTAAEPAAPVAPAAAAPQAPAIHHSPVAAGKAGEALAIRTTIDRPQLLREAYVVYKAQAGWFSLKLLRSGDDEYAALIPADHVKSPGLGYAIEMQQIDGTRAAVFASRAELQPVTVREDSTDVREQWLLGRLDQRRSVVSATGELIRFGTTEGDHAIPCAANQEQCKQGEMVTPTLDDQYWRVEGTYTYRPLRTVSEFGFRAGVVRGRSLVDVAEFDAKKFDVGLNYAGANVRFRLADILHTDLELLGSVTEIGFSVGAGAAVLLGDPYGTKFTLGWQTIGFDKETYFGTRIYTRLDLAATERITIAPSVEVTDMPHADNFGVRLLADAGFVIGRGFSIWVRGGYQARISRSGGPAVGTTLQLGF